MPISDDIPAQLVVELPPEDLAGHLLAYLAKLEASRGRPTLDNSVHNYTKEYRRDDVARPLLEAWSVLEREGFLAREQADWYFLTRRGHEALKAASFPSFRIASLLPKEILHERLLPDVWTAFIRGKHETAVFEAHREVEIAVRKAGNFPDSLIGADLMRKAFHGENGLLTDFERLPAERQALSDLFAGAIGSYKNPHSHRRVKIGPKESVEMIILASHLLSIVDSRSSASEPSDDSPS